MNKRSHLYVTGKILVDLPRKKRRWVLVGSILPDILCHTYFRGHTFQSSFDMVKKTMCNLKKRGRDNWFSYLMLGYVLHYVEDYFTFVHNPIYQGDLWTHILYEKQLEKYLRRERFSGVEQEAFEVLSFPMALQYVEESHRDYLRVAGTCETDARYIYRAVQVVSNCLLLAFAANERVSKCAKHTSHYLIHNYPKVKL